MQRRTLLLACASVPLAGPLARAQQTTQVEVWRDPNCGCCTAWVDRLNEAGFEARARVVPAVGPYRQMLGTPPDLLSCHAGRVAGYALEGHVPPAAIRRLLMERPEGVQGLAVPAMPLGAPGMEVEGHAPEEYDVIAFSANGSRQPWMRFKGALAI